MHHFFLEVLFLQIQSKSWQWRDNNNDMNRARKRAAGCIRVLMARKRRLHSEAERRLLPVGWITGRRRQICQLLLFFFIQPEQTDFLFKLCDLFSLRKFHDFSLCSLKFYFWSLGSNTVETLDSCISSRLLTPFDFGDVQTFSLLQSQGAGSGGFLDFWHMKVRESHRFTQQRCKLLTFSTLKQDRDRPLTLTGWCDQHNHKKKPF